MTGSAALRLLLNHQGHGNQRLSAESRYADVAADGNPPPTFFCCRCANPGGPAFRTLERPCMTGNTAEKVLTRPLGLLILTVISGLPQLSRAGHERGGE